MNMPGFTSEASLYKTDGQYQQQYHQQELASIHGNVIIPAQIYRCWQQEVAYACGQTVTGEVIFCLRTVTICRLEPFPRPPSTA
jgi:hypothetical protein